MSFNIRQSKNCKNWIKLEYELPKPVDETLFESIKHLGTLSVLDFSKFSKSGKKFFKLTQENILTIEGAIHHNLIFFTCSKINEEYQGKFEKALIQWLE